MTIQELADKAEVTTRTIRYYVEQGVLPPPGYGRPAEYTEEHVQRLALIKKLKEQYLPLDEIRDTLQRLSLTEVEQLVNETPIPTQEIAQQQKLESASEYLNNVLGRGIVREQMKKRAVPAQDESVEGEEGNAANKPVGAQPGPMLREYTDPFGDLDQDLLPPPPAPATLPAPASSMPPGAPPSAPAGARSAEVDQAAAATGGTAPAKKKSAYTQSPASSSETEQSQEMERQSTTWERINLGEGVELHYPTGADAGLGSKVAKLVEAARRILGKNPGNGD